VPVTVTAHARGIYHVDHTPRLRRRLEGVDAVVAVSRFDATHLASLLPATPVRYVPNGLQPVPGLAPRPDGSVLCLARLVEDEGLEVLIEAVSLLDGPATPRLEIIGDGPLRDELETTARRLGVAARVAFLGTRTSTEAEAAYRRAAVFALPCRVGRDGDREGLPTALIEALAHGLPVISTDVAGIPEAVQHGHTGLLVPPDDAEALATAIRKLLDDPVLAARLGDNGRRLVAEEFSPSRSTALLRQVFLEVSP
jgi:colanic acid/amylovoran biosynthesis glycosyltransferase